MPTLSGGTERGSDKDWDVRATEMIEHRIPRPSQRRDLGERNQGGGRSPSPRQKPKAANRQRRSPTAVPVITAAANPPARAAAKPNK